MRIESYQTRNTEITNQLSQLSKTFDSKIRKQRHIIEVDKFHLDNKTERILKQPKDRTDYFINYKKLKNMLLEQ